MHQPVDLRSDTVTLPDDAMRQAIAGAAVGDDQYGEDPSVNMLQEQVAELLGKEAALWLPSGTMANQVALRTLTRPGDEVIVSMESHSVWHESGGSAANAGVQFCPVGEQGVFTEQEFIAAVKPRNHVIYPPTTLVQIENTHNRAGGIVFPQDEAEKICEAARQRGIATFLDGARLWNAAVATRTSVAELAQPFELVAVAMSKGLGAPSGSLLGGSAELISQCRRYRRMFGGAMRQIGFMAAAGLHALENNMARLAEDHENARLLAERLAESPFIDLDLDTVQTNILVFNLKRGAPDASTVVQRAKAAGVLLFAFGPHTLRAVTHLDVSRAQCLWAGDQLVKAIRGLD